MMLPLFTVAAAAMLASGGLSEGRCSLSGSTNLRIYNLDNASNSKLGIPATNEPNPLISKSRLVWSRKFSVISGPAINELKIDPFGTTDVLLKSGLTIRLAQSPDKPVNSNLANYEVVSTSCDSVKDRDANHHKQGDTIKIAESPSGTFSIWRDNTNKTESYIIEGESTNSGRLLDKFPVAFEGASILPNIHGSNVDTIGWIKDGNDFIAFALSTPR